MPRRRLLEGRERQHAERHRARALEERGASPSRRPASGGGCPALTQRIVLGGRVDDHVEQRGHLALLGLGPEQPVELLDARGRRRGPRARRRAARCAAGRPSTPPRGPCPPRRPSPARRRRPGSGSRRTSRRPPRPRPPRAGSAPPPSSPGSCGRRSGSRLRWSVSAILCSRSYTRAWSIASATRSAASRSSAQVLGAELGAARPRTTTSTPVTSPSASSGTPDQGVELQVAQRRVVQLGGRVVDAASARARPPPARRSPRRSASRSRSPALAAARRRRAAPAARPRPGRSSPRRRRARRAPASPGRAGCRSSVRCASAASTSTCMPLTSSATRSASARAACSREQRLALGLPAQPLGHVADEGRRAGPRRRTSTFDTVASAGKRLPSRRFSSTSYAAGPSSGSAPSIERSRRRCRGARAALAGKISVAHRLADRLVRRSSRTAARPRRSRP